MLVLTLRWLCIVLNIKQDANGQSLIIFGRIHPQSTTPVNFDEDLVPLQFFHYARC